MNYILTFVLLFNMETAETKIKTEKAYFAGGCFWCTEAYFSALEGVINVAPGYSGGKIENPTYQEVCTGKTGHAEAIEIEFNPEKIAYSKLLEIFFATHDPTTLNRQGADVGTQYRSAIFYSSNEQKSEADKYIKLLISNQIFSSQIHTEVTELSNFYYAEKYHDNYFSKNPNEPYCRIVINPKFLKFKKEYGTIISNPY